jgi:hypothetical protein
LPLYFTSLFCLLIKTDGKSWSFRLPSWRIPLPEHVSHEADFFRRLCNRVQQSFDDRQNIVEIAKAIKNEGTMNECNR